MLSIDRHYSESKAVITEYISPIWHVTMTFLNVVTLWNKKIWDLFSHVKFVNYFLINFNSKTIFMS